MAENKNTETKQVKSADAKPASRQSMTPELAKELGLDPGPYGKPTKK
ncbi:MULTISPECIES: hypothetical protein [Phaeobacter]|uniref:Uncharacterized protein n=1 Tax=Phaeobacter gallaeciensis TaxID=60890 RepID=A0AAD0ED01_9RHOB|nr:MULTISPECIES: hypothetical protein [Phaeobacter]AHD09531.1 hypothetical protein Gal_01775 [Phaeobacter gallaeciensis DSM 26640]ATE92796.1 hypothetical protein PhaeoP11_01768 [Phaeobacter gallaeciensis]ATE97382.1 hypothetical protein PhaeoP73_02078 [Phaeobacter gallaeciensis]ATF01461.1 hypothetical protein PhaeoP75_01818 [Phaeobacter gallaeciensis]ATF05841.1 hypothetical protein PhaeoP63_01766 [Phaeobacter gallaeciensis]